MGKFAEDHTAVSPSTFFATSPGSRTFGFTPDVAGEYTLSFTLRGSNGRTLEASTSFVVKNTDFVFSAVAAHGEIGLGVENAVRFNIVPGTVGNNTNRLYGDQRWPA